MASTGTTSMASKRRLPIANSDWDEFRDYRALFAPSVGAGCRDTPCQNSLFVRMLLFSREALEITDFVVCPHKQINSCTIRISDTLIVITSRHRVVS
jgi:hypothetical protein